MNKENRLIVCIGDTHGCLTETDELLNKIQYNPEQMRVVFCGDLINRGPDSVGCVRRVRELNVECVKGNHEDKHVRYHSHAVWEKNTGKKNPMTLKYDHDQKDHESFSEEDFEWMSKLPTKIFLANSFWAVHAGCEASRDFDHQVDAQLMRVRYVDAKGKTKINNDNFYQQPEGTVYWAEAWNGPQSIVYGHIVQPGHKPRVDNNMFNVCIGIDTGCVFGGELTAWIYDPQKKEYSFESVAAKKVYFEKGKG